jgi:hypothetical protein
MRYHEKKAPPVAEPSRDLTPLDLSRRSVGVRAADNAFGACPRTCGGNASFALYKCDRYLPSLHPLPR